MNYQKFKDIGVADLWFQQDGATCHTVGETIDLLKENFHEQIISRSGLVYVDKPESIDALEVNITRVINVIPADMLERVLENWTHRMEHVRAS